MNHQTSLYQKKQSYVWLVFDIRVKIPVLSTDAFAY
jgi:hypothetical protein